MPSPVRVFVLDDHSVVRDGVRLICEEDPSLGYAGGAASVDEAVPLIRELRPDVVLVDLHLPGRSGITLIRRLHRRGPKTISLVLTVEPEDEMVAEALREGAVGYLSKDLDPDELAAAIHAAVASPPVARGGAVTSASARASGDLSPRETQVLVLLARGHTNRQIATELGVGDRTIASHVANVYRKLQVANRVDAARWALHEGLVEG